MDHEINIEFRIESFIEQLKLERHNFVEDLKRELRDDMDLI